MLTLATNLDTQPIPIAPPAGSLLFANVVDAISLARSGWLPGHCTYVFLDTGGVHPAGGVHHE
jgi:hypothetical protein